MKLLKTLHHKMKNGLAKKTDAGHLFAMSGLKREESAPQHKDSFDRMLICQAITEKMMFATHDSLIPGYDEPCILFV